MAAFADTTAIKSGKAFTLPPSPSNVAKSPSLLDVSVSVPFLLLLLLPVKNGTTIVPARDPRHSIDPYMPTATYCASAVAPAAPIVFHVTRLCLEGGKGIEARDAPHSFDGD